MTIQSTSNIYRFTQRTTALCILLPRSFQCHRRTQRSVQVLVYTAASFVLGTGKADAAHSEPERNSSNIQELSSHAHIPVLLPNTILSPTEGLRISSNDGSTRVELHLAAWLRAESRILDGDVQAPTFNVPLLRPVLHSFLFTERLEFFIQPELAGNQHRILDAFIQWNIGKTLHLRAGAARTPYSRAFTTPIVALQFPDRGAISDRFRLGRDYGFTFFGTASRGAFEYYAGIYNGGDMYDFSNISLIPMPVIRAVYNFGSIVPYNQAPGIAGNAPFGLALGVGAAYKKQNITVDETNNERQSLHSSADLTLMWGPITATSEAFFELEADDGSKQRLHGGAFAQVGVFVWPSRFELAARYGWKNLADTTTSPTLENPRIVSQSIEGGANLYFWTPDTNLGHHLKLSTRYGYEHQTQDEVRPNALEHQHTITVQLQVLM